MSTPIVACTDGSQISFDSLVAGLSLLDLAERTVVVVTVTASPDPMVVTGTGFAGGMMSDEEYQQKLERDLNAATESVTNAAKIATSAGAAEVTTKVLEGTPGHAICDFAEEIGASAIVTGSRGHGGFIRFVLGSVSDHIVRHAPCPVLVSHIEED